MTMSISNSTDEGITVQSHIQVLQEINSSIPSNLWENSGDYSYEKAYKFDLWEHYQKPNLKEWVILFCFLAVFIVSMVGNLLIIVYVLRRKNLQTTVNYFMLNLALADTLVTLIALPPTVMIDVFESWLLGPVLCKLTPYLQMTVASVSTLSLCAVSINRWFVVCHPLKVLAIKSATKTVIAGIVAIWLFSLATVCPVAIVTELLNDYDRQMFPELQLLKSCVQMWGSGKQKAAFHLYFFIICYAFPLVVLAATYTMVFKELRKAKIPGYHLSNKASKNGKECPCENYRKNSEGSFLLSKRSFTSSTNSFWNPDTEVGVWRKTDGTRTSLPVINEEIAEMNKEKNQHKVRIPGKIKKSLSIVSFQTTKKNHSCSKCYKKMQLLRSRRRSATMQVTLIVVFGVCYAPAMVLDLMRQVFDCFSDSQRQPAYFGFAIAHLIMYLNSALNPIIYNFFSGQFRKEFRNTFSCLCKNAGLKKRVSNITVSHFTSTWERSRK